VTQTNSVKNLSDVDLALHVANLPFKTIREVLSRAGFTIVKTGETREAGLQEAIEIVEAYYVRMEDMRSQASHAMLRVAEIIRARIEGRAILAEAEASREEKKG
jgi:hypothetical protein